MDSSPPDGSPTKVSRRSSLPRPTSSGRSTPSRALSRESLNSECSYGDGWTLGDRCYVGGTKAGKVAFIGTTQFGPDEWIGVCLDGPTGKNDGSVLGVRYFQCQPNHGLFCRSNKLYRQRLNPPTSQQDAGPVPPSPLTKSSLKDSRALNVSTASLSAPTASTNAAGLLIGDRVLVNGTKHGILRFLGTVDFAEGMFAGVELDTAQGKNDGSKYGKRYFACKGNYGLFAPLAKVVREPQSMHGGTPGPKTTSTATSAAISRAAGSRGLRSRTASQESLSSLGSARSAASRRVRLGVASLLPDSGSPTPTSPMALHQLQLTHFGSASPAPQDGQSSAIQALHDSLREKEHHLEQLLRERDQERAEMAKASQQMEQMEQELSMATKDRELNLSDMELRLETLQATLRETEAERKLLQDSLEDEKRKTEDLLFQIEEETCAKAELEARVTELEQENAKGKVEPCVSSGGDAAVQLESQGEKVDSGSTEKAGISSEKEAALTQRISDLEQQVASLEGGIKLEQEQKGASREELTRLRSASESVVNEQLDTIAKLETELQKMAESVHASETDKKALEASLKAKEAAYLDVESKLAANNEEVAKLTVHQSSLQASHDEMVKSRSASVSVLTEQLNTIAKLEAELQKMTESVHASEADKKALETSLKAKEAAFLDVESKLASSNEELVKRTAQQSSLQARHDELEQTMLQNSSLSTEQLQLVEQKNRFIEELEFQLKGLQEELVRAQTETKAFTEKNKELTELSLKQQDELTLLKQNEAILRQEDKTKQAKAEATLQEHQSQWTKEKEALMNDISGFQARISELEAELVKSSEQQIALNVQLEKNSEDMKAKCQELEDVNNRFAELSNVSEQTQKELLMLKDENLKFKSEIDSLRESTEKDTADLVARMSAEKSEWMSESERLKSELTSSLEAHKVELDRLEIQRQETARLHQEQVNNALKNQETERAFSLEQQTGLRTELESVKGELTSKVQLLEEAKGKVAEMANAAQDWQKQLHKLGEDNMALKAEIDYLKESSQKSSSELVAQMTEERTKLMSEIERLKSELESSHEAQKKEFDRLDIERQEIVRLHQEGLGAALKTQEAERAQSVEQQTGLRAELESLKGNLDSNVLQLDEAKSRLSELGSASEELQKELNKLREENGMYKAEIENFKESFEKSASELVAQMTAEKEKLVSESERLKCELTSSLEAHKVELDRLEIQRQETARLHQEQVDNALKNQEVERAKSLEQQTELEAVKGNLASNVQQLEEAKSQLSELSSASEELQKELSKLREENSNCKAEIVNLKESSLKSASELVAQMTAETEQLICESSRLKSELEASQAAQKEQIERLETQTRVLQEELAVAAKNQESERASSLEQQTGLRTELESVKGELTSKVQLLEEAKGKVAEMATAAQDWQIQLQKLREENLASQAEIDSLRESSQKSTSELVAQMTAEKEKLMCETQRLQSELAALHDTHKAQLEASGQETARLHHDQVAALNNQVSHAAEEHDKQLKALQEELLSAQAQLAGQKQLENQLNENAKQLETVSSSLQEIQKQNNGYLEANQKLEHANNSLTQQLQEVKNRELNLLAGFEKERTRLKTQLDEAIQANSVQLRPKESDLNGERPVSVLENLELEKFELQERIVDLENRLQNSSAANGVANCDKRAGLCESCAEHAACQSNVDFLNSVIVDLQKANRDLELRNQILQADSIADLNISKLAGKAQLAPRLYCDTCEVFDQHDTEDCPKDEALEPLTHSHTHGSRSQARLYCEHCEMFGHSTANCSGDTETF